MRYAVIALAVVTMTGCNTTLGQRARAMRSPVHASFNAEIHDARTYMDSTGVIAPAASTAMVSLDVALQPVENNGIGVAGRLIGGGDAAPGFVEGSVLLGSRRFAVDLGVGSRTGVDPDKPDEDPYKLSYRFAKIGVRSRLNLGHSPFSVQLRAARHVGIGANEFDSNFGAPDAIGWAGETALSWTRPGSPFTASLGYRIERFEAYRIEQESSALTLGVGLLFGRR